MLLTAAFGVGLLAVPVTTASAATSLTGTLGNDISWPQCGEAFPTGQAFGIVDVNGGLANDANPCLGGNDGPSELAWAVDSAGTYSPKASLYVNTADPGNGVADWPQSGTNPDGTCQTTTVTSGHGKNQTTTTVGADSTACAWQYGYNMVVNNDLPFLAAAAAQVNEPASASSYPWWLDVETGNSWLSGSYGLAMNTADLQGMVYALTQSGATSIGVYSTDYQWGQIVGGTPLGSLAGLPDWIPGATTESGAASNCTTQTAFTGGAITYTQWQPRRGDDGDFVC
jgi:hypothetical protein